MKIRNCFLFALCLMMLVACTPKEGNVDAEITPTPSVEITPTPEVEDEAQTLPDTGEESPVLPEGDEEADAPEVDETPLVEPPATQYGTVYMVTFVGSTAYDVPVTNPDAVGTEECEVLLRELIAGMEELTNWNLDVADIYMGKGGATITFGEDSVLIGGLTEEQEEEFFVFDKYSLLEYALGSLELTVQMALTGEGGDPFALDVYFATHDDQPLGFIEEGIIIPIDQPYDGFVETTW